MSKKQKFQSYLTEEEYNKISTLAIAHGHSMAEELSNLINNITPIPAKPLHMLSPKEFIVELNRISDEYLSKPNIEVVYANEMTDILIQREKINYFNHMYDNLGEEALAPLKKQYGGNK